MRFCTTAGALELPHARVLAGALARHHPGSTLTVLLSGRPRVRGDEPFAVLSSADLDVFELDRLLGSHEREDTVLALRPHLVRHVLRDGDDPVVYLDAAHDVRAPLDPVSEQLAARPVLLSRRVAGGLPEDGREPAARDLRVHGTIDPGFVAVAPGEGAERFLDWWAERTAQAIPHLEGTRGAGKPEQGRRQLRRVLDLAAGVLPTEVGELEDPGCEASAWNLHERPLTTGAGGELLAAGRLLRSLSLVGYDPGRPHLLAPRATRAVPSADPLLAALLDDYAGRLRAAGWSDITLRGELGRRLADGVPFSDRLQRLYAEALGGGEDFGDVFTVEGTAAFHEWLVSTDVPGGGAGITRYLYRVYRDRGDLPRVYPELDGGDGAEFATWCWVYGRTEMDIPDEFLPPRPAALGPSAAAAAPLSVDVAGYFTGTLGLGEAARLYVRALRAADVAVRTTTVDTELPADHSRTAPRDYGRVAYDEARRDGPVLANLVCVNADELPRFAARVGERFFAGRHTIGVWAWETDAIPRRWDAAFAHLDEIWVYSRYVAENLGRFAPVPVVPVPPPITPPEAGEEPELGLPDGFRFMFMFDFFSTVKRKNPVGVIQAFTRAFAPGEGPHLVIKTIHAEHRRADFEELAFAASGRPDVHIVDRSLGVGEKNGLLASCDAYVSLHRSEGYGLPLAECMAMGKPVVATGYSGNLDFMTPANSYLVDHTLTQVGGDVEIYPAEGVWAEPDLDDAAAKLRAVWEDPQEAARRGARAAADIAEHLSPERVGAIARARLERLRETATAGAAPAVSPALGEVLQRLSSASPGEARGARGAARRALFRVLRPFIAQERALDRSMATALEGLERELASQRRALEALRDGHGD